MRALPPVRRQIVVAAEPDVAFKVFTEEIGLWWPLARHSVYDGKESVEFRDGVLIEKDAVWGSVLDWEPPSRLRFTWHPGRGPENPTEVLISFTSVVDGQTLVTLEHSGWERLADPVAAADEYRNGWPRVLAGYGERAASSAKDTGGGAVWLALMHYPGLHFDPSGIRDHFAFIQRLHGAGVLVAAGPLEDAQGEGMTVVRATSPEHAAELVRMAQDDDKSVRNGTLSVRVRPWSVRVTGD